MAVFKKCQATLVGVGLALCLAAGAAPPQLYTLVQGLDKFNGSSTAWHLLETNGFVVADPAFKQIFEPYLEESMPVFITTDSAWHAYHVLLEEGMHDLETAQSRRLAEFSRRLWSSASEQAKSDAANFSDLARFAAIGLAFQDETFRNSLPEEQKSVVETLFKGKGEARVEIGFPLWAPSFKAEGNEGAKDMASYFAARKWYATVDFRLSNARETRLALCLTWLIHKEPDLLQAWHQLSDPWDALVGPAEDGTVPLYSDLIAKKIGLNFSLAEVLKNAAALRPALAEATHEPSFNDQRLAADEEAKFGKVIRGFRLFPPRWSQSEICFQRSGNLRNLNRIFPSGLDLFVASPSLRSPAAERALSTADGSEVEQAVRKQELGGPPDSITGRALRLLAVLQEPLPESIAPALRSEAWADAQLWAQMGAWAEAEHAGNGQRTTWIEEGAIVKPATGMVAPYPKFFEGLSKLALETAVALEKAGIDEPFDSKTAAHKLLEGILWQEGLGTGQGAAAQRGGSQNQETANHPAGLMEQFNQFWERTLEPHQAEIENNPPASQKLMNDLESLARRSSTQTTPAEADLDVLQRFFQERQTAPKLLRDFAPFCDKLAELARKHLEGTALTDNDTKWISEYGLRLAHFQSFSGSSADTPHDDFPIVNQMQSSPDQKASLYAGLGRPQSLYIILPFEGRLKLFQGAVMTYREFVRTNAATLDDSSWRTLAATGNIPSPPAFTRGFQAERGVEDLIKSLTTISTDNPDYKALSEDLDELQSRVTDRDVPALLTALGKCLDTQPGPAADGIASALGKLHWAGQQKALLAMLETNEAQNIRFVVPILMQRPDELDAAFLCSNFDHVPPPARRVYCTLLARVTQTDQTRGTLLRALSDASPGVRWEAATALGATTSDVSQKVAALLGRLNDDNEYVTAVAVSVLGQMKATNVASILMINLQERLQKPEPSAEFLQPQSDAVQTFAVNNIPANMPRPRGIRQPRVGPMRMRPFLGGFPGQGEGSPARDALIEALGDLDYKPAEELIFGLLDGPHATSAGRALKELAPARLAQQLETQACDKKADPQVRDRALQLLGTPPANSSATSLIPLLDDTTVVPMIGRRAMAGRDWRICDRAATTIGSLLGRPVRIGPMMPVDQRDQQIEEIRASLKAAY